MVNYKDLGLVNTREMFKRAVAGGYAIPAFNFNTMEQMQAIVQAAVETKSPVIMQVSKGARNYANATILRYMAEGAVAYAKELGCAHPEIVLHLDHGDSFELCKDCIDMGFSSVMYDGSALPYEENIKISRQVVEYAHQYDVTVECELGVLAGVEDEVASEVSHYTKPEEVIDFATRTGCDSLAISIGTSHGAYKFKPEQCTRDPKTGKLVPPPLAFDVLHEIEKKLPGFPIVLHGSSSVPQDEVDIINANGGALKAAVGIPEDTGKIISGGPMMGKAISNLNAFTVKGMSSLLLMTEKESKRGEVYECLRCGKCVQACPMGLEPYMLHVLTDLQRYEDCEKHGIMNCIECGSCSFGCPSNRPILDMIRVGKNKTGAMIRARK